MTYRTIVEEHDFEYQLAEIKPDPRVADDFIDGVKWVLAREPNAGRRTNPGSQVWIVLQNQWAPDDQWVIYYTFDSNYVYLLSIEKASDLEPSCTG